MLLQGSLCYHRCCAPQIDFPSGRLLRPAHCGHQTRNTGRTHRQVRPCQAPCASLELPLRASAFVSLASHPRPCFHPRSTLLQRLNLLDAISLWDIRLCQGWAYTAAAGARAGRLNAGRAPAAGTGAGVSALRRVPIVRCRAVAVIRPVLPMPRHRLGEFVAGLHNREVLQGPHRGTPMTSPVPVPAAQGLRSQPSGLCLAVRAGRGARGGKLARTSPLRKDCATAYFTSGGAAILSRARRSAGRGPPARRPRRRREGGGGGQWRPGAGEGGGGGREWRPGGGRHVGPWAGPCAPSMWGLRMASARRGQYLRRPGDPLREPGARCSPGDTGLRRLVFLRLYYCLLRSARSC